jgi:anti-sigma factor RsiW
MAVNDSDLELLHAYLDSELPVAECEGLWRRLAIERDLMGELDRLRQDHSVRSMVWSSLEPDDSSIARLQAKLMRATRREDIMYWVGNAARIVASAAALILFGFTVGWLGRDHYNAVPNMAGDISTVPSHRMAEAGNSLEVPVVHKAAVYLKFTDSAGKVVAVGPFDSEDEANQFVRDYQAAHSAAPAGGDTNIVPPMDKF